MDPSNLWTIKVNPTQRGESQPALQNLEALFRAQEPGPTSEPNTGASSLPKQMGALLWAEARAIQRTLCGVNSLPRNWGRYFWANPGQPANPKETPRKAGALLQTKGPGQPANPMETSSLPWCPRGAALGQTNPGLQRTLEEHVLPSLASQGRCFG